MKREWCFRRLRQGIIPAVAMLTVGIFFPDIAMSQPPANGKANIPDGLAVALVLERAFVKVIAETEKSVVSIARVKRTRSKPRLRANEFFPRVNPGTDNPASPDFIPNEFGSGIIIAPLKDRSQRFILTNYHVVKGGPLAKKGAQISANLLYVRMANRRGYYAKILAADPRSDLAVLTIDYAALGVKPEALKPLRFTSQTTFRKGQLVLAFGNPYALAKDGSASVSWGMISNISRKPKPAGDTPDLTTRKKETIHHFGTLLQVDTRLNLGTSGGALINLKGELIGITTSLAALDGYEKSVGYAIPFDKATRKTVETLARGQEVEYGFLGISPQDVSPQKFNVLPKNFRQQFAAMASSVHRNAPAQRAGMRSGDVILSVNDVPIRDKYELMREIARLVPGTVATIRIWRDNERRELLLKPRLGKWPVLNHEEIIATSPRFPEWRGLTLDYPTGHYRYLKRPYEYHRAVLLTQLRNPKLQGNPQFSPGVFISHVNGTAVETPAEFHTAVSQLKGTVTLKLASGKVITIPK